MNYLACDYFITRGRAANYPILGFSDQRIGQGARIFDAARRLIAPAVALDFRLVYRNLAVNSAFRRPSSPDETIPTQKDGGLD
jgi:hypothetical protein